jgi:hypothetical protein
VSQDAVQDEKQGLVLQARLLLARASIQINDRKAKLAPGMAVAAVPGQ